MKRLLKKGQLGDIPNTIMMVALIGVISVVVAIVLDKLDDGYTATTSTQAQIVGNGTDFLTNVTGQLPLLGTVIILGVVISAIVVYFWKKTGGV